jgi:hypothetical protein
MRIRFGSAVAFWTKDFNPNRMPIPLADGRVNDCRFSLDMRRVGEAIAMKLHTLLKF